MHWHIVNSRLITCNIFHPWILMNLFFLSSPLYHCISSLVHLERFYCHSSCVQWLIQLSSFRVYHVHVKFAFFEIFKRHLIHRIVMYIDLIMNLVFVLKFSVSNIFFKPIWILHVHVFPVLHRDVLVINIMVTTMYHWCMAICKYSWIFCRFFGVNFMCIFL